jgi:hypothetical protein
MLTSLRAVNAGFATINVPELDTAPWQPVQLTPVQQMQQLQNAGVSADQIAMILGLPQDVVVEVLGSTATEVTEDGTGFPGVLSIFA